MMNIKKFFNQTTEGRSARQRKPSWRNESRRNCFKRFLLIQLIIFAMLSSIDVWAVENLNVGILEEPRTLIWSDLIRV